MTKQDEWAIWSLKRFERARENGDPWPGYWANCILNYADYLKLIWC